MSSRPESPSTLYSDKALYRAFISYSHVDSQVARRLHRELESYSVPSRLVGRITHTGTIAKNIGKIFRDRDELSVSTDLTGEINDALRRSQFLLVLCSRAAAQSQWVNQEVLNFKRLKRQGNIIAVIVDGEPFASNHSGREHEECFVPALRFQIRPDGQLDDLPAEPIAADLRPGKDGKRLVKMKIISGLLGVELDDLIRREVQRRNRQLFWLSCVMGAIVIVMGILSALAVTSRNQAVIARDDARRQKDQAEGLIDFMLGDLRDKLKPVGRLDSLDAVGGRAAAYFESLKPGEFDPETRARLARTKLLSGEVLYSQGRGKEAAGQFDQAYEITAALYAAEPEKPERIFDHAQSEYWVGYGRFRNAQYVSAEERFSRYMALAGRLVAMDSQNLTWKIELASARTNLGIVRLQLLRSQEALADLEAAAEMQADIIARQPMLRSFTAESDRSRQQTKLVMLHTDLGQILDWKAIAERSVGNLGRAIETIRHELEVYQDVERLDPKNTTILQSRWAALRARGRIHLELHEAALALNDFEAAIQIAVALGRLDEQNKRWAQLLARCRLDAAEARLELGDMSASKSGIDAALSVSEAFLKSPGTNRAVKIQLSGTAQLIAARWYYVSKSFDGASASLAELFKVTDSILADTPDEVETLLLAAEGQLLSGDVNAARGRLPEANVSWRAALQTAERASVTPNVRLTALTALARQRLGDQAGFADLLGKVCNTGYRRGEFIDFCRRTRK